MARRRPAVHCTAHRTNGEPCGGWAVHGAAVCQAHGGRAPQVQAAATERLAVEAANRLAIPVETTAADALQDALARVNGEVVWLAEQVAALSPEDLTWGMVERRTTVQQGPAGERMNPVIQMRHAERRHPYWVAMTDAIARRTAIAAEMRRLGIEERQAAVQERMGREMAVPWLALLADLRVVLALDRRGEEIVKAAISRQIRALDGGG